MEPELIPARPWKRKHPPRRVLAIRLQAMGDTVITLPYLQSLRNSLPPDTQLDLLTRKEVSPIPRDLQLFDHVYAIGGKRHHRMQMLLAILLLPTLWLRRYDVVIDLQHNRISTLVRKLLHPRSWSAFDRYSPRAAGERTRLTIEAAGLGPNYFDARYKFGASNFDEDAILKTCGWDGKSKLVILNPASAFPTRHWPMDYYVAFAKQWLNTYPNTQFIVLGIGFIRERAAFLKAALGERLLYMIDNTSPSEGFRLIRRAQFMLSEDSGLMHMSWVLNRPTVALLGGTRSDWVRPQNDHSLVFSSDDLPCGNCMQESCHFGNVHCLTRFTPDIVFEKVNAFIQHLD